MIYNTYYKSPIGNLVIVSDGKNLLSICLEGQKYFNDSISETITLNDKLPLFVETKKWLDKYFNGLKPKITDLPLAPRGSEFRQKVWNILCSIPYGEVTTYGEIAKKICKIDGKISISSQAVGGAIGHNPLLIIIPCHRVVGTNGSLTGFAAGIDTKIKLLENEGVDMTKLYRPKNQ